MSNKENPVELMAEVASYLRTALMTLDRAVKEEDCSDGAVTVDTRENRQTVLTGCTVELHELYTLGYWQTTDWLEGLKELSERLDKCAGENSGANSVIKDGYSDHLAKMRLNAKLIHATSHFSKAIDYILDLERAVKSEPVYYQYREIGEESLWQYCSKEDFDYFSKSPEYDTKTVGPSERLNDLEAVLSYYRNECTGAEPSLSVFQRDVDRLIVDTEPEKPKQGFECKHGTILYGNKCLNCEREKQESSMELFDIHPFLSDAGFYLNLIFMNPETGDSQTDELLLTDVIKDTPDQFAEGLEKLAGMLRAAHKKG
jgi:hypothetical protein